MKTKADRRKDAMRLAAEAECDVRTALRVIDGLPVRKLVSERLREAAKKLKIRLPGRSGEAK